MALPNAKNQYLKTQIETASKEQLVVMLFDGIIRFTELARKAIQEERIEESHNALMRAQAIVMELICTVDRDKGGEVANNLMSLHAYAFNCLIVCNMKKDVSKIDEVQNIYRELREGWVVAMDKLGISGSSGAQASATASAPTGGASAPAIPKAPLAAMAPKAAPSPAPLPVAPAAMPGKTLGGSGGVMASAPVSAPTAAAGYGMGRTAILGIAMPGAAVASAPVAAKPAIASPVPSSPASAPKVAAPVSAQQAALLSAYGKTRSIA